MPRRHRMRIVQVVFVTERRYTGFMSETVYFNVMQWGRRVKNNQASQRQAPHSVNCITSGLLNATSPVKKAQPKFIVISHRIDKVHKIPCTRVVGTFPRRMMIEGVMGASHFVLTMTNCAVDTLLVYQQRSLESVHDGLQMYRSSSFRSDCAALFMQAW